MKKKTTNHVLERISDTGLKLLLAINPEETYKTVVEEGSKLVNAEYTSLFLEKEGFLYRVHTTGPEKYQLKLRKNGFTYSAFRSGKIIINTRKTMSKFHPEIAKSEVHSFVNLPLTYQKRSIGVLNLQTQKRNYFTKRRIEILKLFGSMATLAIRNNQLYSTTIDALKARDLFISMAAHELRTPVTSINGYVGLVQERLDQDKLPKAEWLKNILSKTHQLTEVVNRVLEVDKIKTEKFEYKWKEWDAGLVVKKAIEIFTSIYPNRKIILNNSLSEASLIADIDKISQALVNILINAAQNSHTDEEISINTASKKNHISFQIMDHGKGIPKNELERIFDQFYKGKGSRKESLGLGLFISKAIITQHQGKIRARSKEGAGTTFEVRLPKLRT